MMPNLYLFHPVCEAAIANASPYYQPPQILRDFERDLDLLPAFFASENDYIVLEKKLSSSFKDYFSLLSPLPNIVTTAEIPKQIGSFNRFESWCISPMLLEKWKKKLAIFSESYQDYLKNYTAKIVELHSKHTALTYCRKITSEAIDFILPPEDTAKVFTSIPEIENFLYKEKQIVLKAPISSSGRGIQIFRHSNLAVNHYQWMQTILKQQGLILAEKLLDNKLNIGAQFFIKDKKATFLDFSHFNTNKNGSYQANLLNFNSSDLLPEFEPEKLDLWANKLTVILNNSIYTQNYSGYMNVDGMIYKDKQGKLKLHPFMEVNCRYTMGTLELKLKKLIHKKSRGKFTVFYQKGENFETFSQEMSLKHKAIFKEKKPYSGYFPLVEPTKNKKFGAYILLYAKN